MYMTTSSERRFKENTEMATKRENAGVSELEATEERGSASTWVAEGERPSKVGRTRCRPVTWHHRDGAEAIAEVTGYSQSGS